MLIVSHIRRNPLFLITERLITTNNMKKSVFTSLVFMMHFCLGAQSITNDFIFESSMGEQKLKTYLSSNFDRADLYQLRLLSEELGIFACQVPEDKVEDFKALIHKNESCRLLSNNQFLSSRQKPNDVF